LDTHVSHRPCLTQHLNPALFDQHGQSALQGAARQAAALRPGDGLYAHQTIGLSSNQRKQLIKLGLGVIRGICSGFGWNANSIAPLKVAWKDDCDK
jgi:hypothetical protein